MIAARVELDLKPAEGLNKGGLRKATRIGINRAASPVKAAVVRQAEVVKRFGFMAKAVRIRLRMYSADRTVVVIGPSSKFTRTKGTYKRGKRKGQPRKIIPAKYAHLVNRKKHWLDKAHAAASPGFLRTVGTEIGREVEAELARRATAGR